MANDKHPPSPTDSISDRVAIPEPIESIDVPGKLGKKKYERELAKLHIGLVKMQNWVKHQGKKIVVIFEGRDAAGKGGAIKSILECLNPRICRVVALGVPTERERSQWYFQRYASQLPAGGEIALFDRSWYNRAGVEHVMGFCSQQEYREFLHATPEFERMLIRSDIQLIKYWFSVSDDEQERRFQERMTNPVKSWKISPMDVQSRKHWVDYSRAKDTMFEYTDIDEAPWHVVSADDKRRARLNCIRHLLSLIPFEQVPSASIVLPERQTDASYVRPPYAKQRFVPEYY
jgi:polyphosphate kinase